MRLITTIAVAAALVVAAPAIAGKGGGGSKADSSITLNAPSSALAIQPALGSYVTFTVTYPTSVKIPRVEVLCYQNDASGSPTLVYGEAGSPDHSFLLGGGASLWLTNGGPASCTANLYYFTWQANQPGATYLASTSFGAAG